MIKPSLNAHWLRDYPVVSVDHTHTHTHTHIYTYIYRAFHMFSVITNMYNKKTKGPPSMEFFTATGKVKKVVFFFL